MNTVHVMIVDDHAVVLEGLERVLSLESGIDIIAKAQSLAEAQALLRNVTPDVILTDLRLPDSQGCDTVANIRQLCPAAKIIVLTGYGDPAAEAALGAGADAFLDKQTASDEIVKTVLRLTSSGGIETHDRWSLTAREREVARLAAEGLSNTQIARLLYVSQNTVKAHLAHVFRKTGLSSRVDLARCWNNWNQNPAQ